MYYYNKIFINYFMKYICINLECDSNFYFEKHDKIMYH